MRFLKFYFFLFFSLGLEANELILSAQIAKSLGYLKKDTSKHRDLKSKTQNQLAWAPHSLNWPVSFQNPLDPIGNDMVEYQPYDGGYFHGGLDLLSPFGSHVRAPVAGRIEAGHYAYTPQSNGSLEKMWKPWPQSGNPTYFEVAIITDEGFRFEFHHVDRNTLPPAIVEKLNKGRSSRVEVGEVLGDVLEWEIRDYHHIHYNIIDPNGVTRVNPQYLSPEIADSIAPEVIAMAYKSKKNNIWMEFKNFQRLNDAEEIQVVCKDQKIREGFEHPPVSSELVFQNGKKTSWNFKRSLEDENSMWPELWNFYARSLNLFSKNYETWGDYGHGEFIVRLKVPEKAEGPFKIKLIDDASNETLIEGENSTNLF